MNRIFSVLALSALGIALHAAKAPATGSAPPGPGSSTIYCTAKVNSLGCTPQIATAGTASVSSPAAFVVLATGVVNQVPGLLFYSFQPAAIPYACGYICVQPPLRRTFVQMSGGTPPPPLQDCSGVLSMDFNAWIQFGPDPSLTAGTQVYAEYYYRDPPEPCPTPQGLHGLGLTDAVTFVIGA